MEKAGSISAFTACFYFSIGAFFVQLYQILMFHWWEKYGKIENMQDVNSFKEYKEK